MVPNPLFAINLPQGTDWWATVLVTAAAVLLIILMFQARREPTRRPPTDNTQDSPPGPEDNPASQESEYQPPVDPEEKRVARRRRGNQVKVEITDEKGEAEPFLGWVEDRSMNGLRLSVRRPVEADIVLTVRALDAPRTAPSVQVRIRRVIEVDGRWELGCEFVKPPSYAVLMLFG